MSQCRTSTEPALRCPSPKHPPLQTACNHSWGRAGGCWLFPIALQVRIQHTSGTLHGIQLSYRESAVFLGHAFSSMAPQPVSLSLPSILLVPKEASLAFCESWSCITTSNVFFLLSGSHQPPAEEDRAAIALSRAHGVQK